MIWIYVLRQKPARCGMKIVISRGFIVVLPSMSIGACRARTIESLS